MKIKDLPKIERPTLPFRSPSINLGRRRGEKLIQKGPQNLKEV